MLVQNSDSINHYCIIIFFSISLFLIETWIEILSPSFIYLLVHCQVQIYSRAASLRHCFHPCKGQPTPVKAQHINKCNLFVSKYPKKFSFEEQKWLRKRCKNTCRWTKLPVQLWTCRHHHLKKNCLQRGMSSFSLQKVCVIYDFHNKSAGVLWFCDKSRIFWISVSNFGVSHFFMA